ncbi:hypothetical protein [Pseudomonas savastanoi]|uniref:hypothetical protein n=1 Tax=Pseudomonas savastanoi TaxID=29438 RepID=UPI000E327E28|nr:hypothetical protein [Pseudomonas savastanoi]
MTISEFPKRTMDASLIRFKPSAEKAFLRFRYWHIETLLNRAADLLDRCLIDQGRYDALRAQAFLTSFATRSDLEALKLQEERFDNGNYEFPFTDAVLKESLLTKIKGEAQQAATEYSNVNAHAPSSSAAAQIHDSIAALGRAEMECQFAQLELERAQGPLGYVKVSMRQLSELQSRIKDKVAAAENGGPLDFTAQADQIKERMTRDYIDAADRILVASEGLSKIFGYSDKLVDKLNAIKAGSFSSVNDATAWVREAIRWLAAFSQNDQSFTITISLRQALQGQWDDCVRNGMVSEVVVDESVFNLHRYVRFRGLCASLIVRDSATVVLAKCVVRLPESAKYILVDEHGQDVVVSGVDQSAAVMPSCTLGRVVNIGIGRDPEICGAVSLMNGSPIAESGAAWSVHVQLSDITMFDEINDVFLEIQVSGQPR